MPQFGNSVLFRRKKFSSEWKFSFRFASMMTRINRELSVKWRNRCVWGGGGDTKSILTVKYLNLEALKWTRNFSKAPGCALFPYPGSTPDFRKSWVIPFFTSMTRQTSLSKPRDISFYNALPCFISCSNIILHWILVLHEVVKCRPSQVKLSGITCIPTIEICIFIVPAVLPFFRLT
jgi:hypothetical protein